MKKKLLVMSTALVCAFGIAGCGTTVRKMTESASGKNLNMDGYLMLGELETANPETATPQGKLVIGRVTYKSRKVGIPADQKVPTTGYFKSTRTKSLFGTEEEIVEYDFTASGESEAASLAHFLFPGKESEQRPNVGFEVRGVQATPRSTRTDACE